MAQLFMGSDWNPDLSNAQKSRTPTSRRTQFESARNMLETDAVPPKEAMTMMVVS